MLEVFWTERMKGIPDRQKRHTTEFLSSMTKRLIQGHARYGVPSKEKGYLSRLKKEIAAYSKTGNREHLINAANYCLLEDLEPQNKKYHFDPEARSVTRSD